MTADLQFLERAVVQLEDLAEACHVLPEEAHQSQLTKNAHDLGCTLFSDNDPVNSASKNLNSSGEGVGVFQKSRGLFSAKEVLDMVEWYRLILACPNENVFDLRGVSSDRVSEVGDKE